MRAPHNYWGILKDYIPRCTKTVSDEVDIFSAGFRASSAEFSESNGQQAVLIVPILDFEGGMSADGSVSLDSSPNFIFQKSTERKKKKKNIVVTTYNSGWVVGIVPESINSLSQCRG